MRTINVQTSAADLSQLLDQTSVGEEVIVAVAGDPVARLTKLEPAPRRERRLRLV